MRNSHILIDNVVSGDRSFGGTLSSQSFLHDIIDIIIASSIKIDVNQWKIHSTGFH